MKDKFEQLKKVAEEIRMTESEKSLMRSRIEETMSHFPIREAHSAPAPVKSPFRFGAFARSFAFMMIGFIAGGGGLAFASEQALPGDTLYAIKTEVTEEIVAAFQPTPEAKIAWEEERIKRRAAEIAMLQVKGELKEERALIATREIEDSNMRVERELVKLSEELSFDGIVFGTADKASAAPSSVTLMTSGNERMIIEEALPTREDLTSFEARKEEPDMNSRERKPLEELPVEEDIASMSPSMGTLELPNTAIEVAERPKLDKTDFSNDVLDKISNEIDKLEASKKINDQVMSDLNNLLEKARKAEKAGDTRGFFQIIREIKMILEKLIAN
jgi:hypothetical protein